MLLTKLCFLDPRKVASMTRFLHQEPTAGSDCQVIQIRMVTDNRTAQGSNLKTFLFTYFLHGIGLCSKSSTLSLYADDLRWFFGIIAPENHILLQEDLNSVYNYYNKNKLSFNLDKCIHTSFTRNQRHLNFKYHVYGTIPRSATTVNHLTFLFDCKLRLVIHVDAISKRTYKPSGFITHSHMQTF